jgi:hypothetical protein
VAANGTSIGGVAAARGGAVEVKLTVVTAPWVVVEKAEVRLAVASPRPGAPAPPREAQSNTLALTPKKNAAGAMVAEGTFTLKLKADDALVVMVSGTKPMRPVLSGDDVEISPWAMSGPIWVDVDGDGKALGRTR